VILETLLILALAAWRVAHLLVNERGPLAIGDLARGLSGVRQVKVQRTGYNNTPFETTECQADNEIGRMLCCIYCTSFWTSGMALALWCIGTGLTLSFAEAVVNWFAVAALCIVAEKVNRYV
jgi:hypothetical protein